MLISALSGQGLDELTLEIETRIAATRVVLDLELDSSDGAGEVFSPGPVPRGPARGVIGPLEGHCPPLFRGNGGRCPPHDGSDGTD